MTDGPERSGGRTRLEKQADEILDNTEDAFHLVAELDFGYVQRNDCFADWHASTPLVPMVRALLLKELEDHSFSELHRRLSDNPDQAALLGFEDVPARTTFGRAWRDRFDDDLRQMIEFNARRIRELAHERGCAIGLDAIEPEDKSDASKRTEDRFINEKAKEVTEEMQRLVFPVFDFDRAENAKYDTDAFCEVQSHLGLSASAAESGTDLFADDTQREDSPDGDTHLRNIKQLDPDQIQGMIDEGIGRMVDQAKRQLEFERPAEVAIDMTYVAYYGDRDELEMIMGAPATKEYEWCYKFATLTVVGENVKFTLAMRPVQKGDTMGEVVRDLFWQAREHVSIRRVYADSEFCSADVLQALKHAGVKYVIPSPKNKRVKREIDRMDRDVEVRSGYTIFGQVKGEGSRHPAETNLVLLPSSKDDDKTVAFVTNEDVDDEIGLNRRRAKGVIQRYSRRWPRVAGRCRNGRPAKGVIQRYSRRWGIENSYKTIKDFLAWTTSKDFSVRLFYFGFAVLLYDMWLLVDLVVQVSLDAEHRYKPRVTAKRFLNLARKQLAGIG